MKKEKESYLYSVLVYTYGGDSSKEKMIDVITSSASPRVRYLVFPKFSNERVLRGRAVE
jgi:hypothetical protein